MTRKRRANGVLKVGVKSAVGVEPEGLSEQKVNVASRGDLVVRQQRVEEEHAAVLEDELLGIRLTQTLNEQAEAACRPLKLQR